MKWKKLTIHTTEEAEDFVVAMLSEFGIDNVEIIDKKPAMDEEEMRVFAEVMPKMEADDGLSDVVFYLDEDADVDTVVSEVEEGLEALREYTEIGSGAVERDETEDKDWANNWKEHFHAFYVDDILIKPTWVEAPEDDHSLFKVEIDPGTAFGTGAHETTQLCIRGLKRELKPGMKVLDVGTGSGILGIVALKMGAASVFGTDIDEMAVGTARENIELNGFSEKEFPVIVGDIISDPETKKAAGFECYDLVVANILADIIIALQGVIAEQMKTGAVFIMSGIINTKAEQVQKALEENGHFEILGSDTQGEWVSFTARKIA